MSTPNKNATYVGYSTVVGDGLMPLYDIELIKQDFLNVFNMSKGECITDPSKGSIIWDMIFEQGTDDNMNLIEEDSMKIFNSDPRVKVLNFAVEKKTFNGMFGYQLIAELLYVGLGIKDIFIANFFKSMT